MVQASLTR